MLIENDASVMMDSAMGQIPRSTERISSFSLVICWDMMGFPESYGTQQIYN